MFCTQGRKFPKNIRKNIAEITKILCKDITKTYSLKYASENAIIKLIQEGKFPCGNKKRRRKRCVELISPALWKYSETALQAAEDKMMSCKGNEKIYLWR
ncbi:MAG: hypothetical protein ACI4RH_12800 [Huintestinicola sp.]